MLEAIVAAPGSFEDIAVKGHQLSVPKAYRMTAKADQEAARKEDATLTAVVEVSQRPG